MSKLPLLLAVLLCSSLASAQVARDRVEKAQDLKALRQDGRQTRDDGRDAAKLLGLVARFDAARARGDLAALSEIDGELRGLLATEIAENRVEYRKDRREIRKDLRELGSDRGGTVAKRDDRRDLADDRRDLRAEALHAQRIAQIDAELAGLAGRLEPGALDTKRALMGELVGLARQELRQDARETREDRGELGEDRRELRHDRR